jgi:hypothetical protein
MRDRRSIVVDLLIELIGGAIIAVITWFATIGSETLAIPAWAVATIAAAVIAAVAFMVAYVIRTRHIQRVVQQAIIHNHIPAALGQFRWEPSADSAITLTDQITGGQQTLTFSVEAPQAGTKYRADLARV